MANQATDLVLRQERLDETPLLLAQLRKMQVPQLLDECFTTHGNWQGLSLGNLITIWLAFILAEGNHRLSHLREWVAARSFSLQAALGVTFVETDLTDDRLAQALDYLHDEAPGRSLKKNSMPVCCVFTIWRPARFGSTRPAPSPSAR